MSDRIYYCENPTCTHQAEYRVRMDGDRVNVCGPCLDAMAWIDERVITGMVAIPLCDMEDEDDDS